MSKILNQGEGWDAYYAPESVAEALDLLAQHGDTARVIAGGTDLILELERGVRSPKVLVDVSHITGLDEITYEGGSLSLGATVTHNQVVASPDAVAHAFPLTRACWQVGAPQIRNRGTIAGNLVTASPANDTITPLWAMDATVTLASQMRGERTLSFDRFFLGVRRTALAPEEMLVRIQVPALGPAEHGTFLKLGLRRTQAISVVNVAVLVNWDMPAPDEQPTALQRLASIRRASIALGAVAPMIVRAGEAEAFLAGRSLDDDTIARASALAASAARPISDIRGSADYRRDMVRVLVARALRQLRDGTERAGWPERPVLLQAPPRARRGDPLWSPTPSSPPLPAAGPAPKRRIENRKPERRDAVRFTLNGREVTLHGVGGKTLLRALREDAGLTGTKEGCAEGECGACTVWLDGSAVMSCLVPAERAEGCQVVTVEGLESLSLQPEGRTNSEGLHPLQQAFIDAGAVQCGYCTPGLLMSAALLLEEVAHPTAAQVRDALSGNLCRCTGYYTIVKAVERAAER